MKTILLMDSKNYDENWNRFYREAARVIIIKNGKIALVKSTKEGWYKFPGGGIEKGETAVDAVVRETREETGIILKPSTINEYGMTHEIRKSIYYENEIFEQKSFYFTAEAEDEVIAQNLNGYEAELGYVLEWVDMMTAYEANMRFESRNDFAALKAFPTREALVLKMLMESV